MLPLGLADVISCCVMSCFIVLLCRQINLNLNLKSNPQQMESMYCVHKRGVKLGWLACSFGQTFSIPPAFRGVQRITLFEHLAKKNSTAELVRRLYTLQVLCWCSTMNRSKNHRSHRRKERRNNGSF